MNPETKIQNDIRLKLTESGYTCFRANVGMFYNKQGSPIRTGLPKGFPDLFGFHKDTNEIFFIEVKTPSGKENTNQLAFRKKVLEANNLIHGIARSADEALKIVDERLVGFDSKG